MSRIRAAVAVENRRTEVREFAAPPDSADSGLLNIELTGVCGSDWPYYNNYPSVRGAMILGHESVGHIERAGTTAKARWGLREGDRVSVHRYPHTIRLLHPVGHSYYNMLREKLHWNRE